MKTHCVPTITWINGRICFQDCTCSKHECDPVYGAFLASAFTVALVVSGICLFLK